MPAPLFSEGKGSKLLRAKPANINSTRATQPRVPRTQRAKSPPEGARQANAASQLEAVSAGVSSTSQPHPGTANPQNLPPPPNQFVLRIPAPAERRRVFGGAAVSPGCSPPHLRPQQGLGAGCRPLSPSPLGVFHFPPSPKCELRVHPHKTAKHLSARSVAVCCAFPRVFISCNDERENLPSPPAPPGRNPGGKPAPGPGSVAPVVFQTRNPFQAETRKRVQLVIYTSASSSALSNHRARSHHAGAHGAPARAPPRACAHLNTLQGGKKNVFQVLSVLKHYQFPSLTQNRHPLNPA